MKIKLISLLILIIIASCHHAKKTVSGQAPTPPSASAPDSSGNALNATWQLNYITGPRIAFEGLYPRQKPTLTFNLPAPEANGNSSCNGYSCKVTVDGTKITFGDPLATMMACEGGGEQVFFKTLKQVNTWNISDDTTLTLLMGDIAMMRFVKK